MRSPLFKPTDAERASLLERQDLLQQPQAMLPVLQAALPPGLAPAAIVSSSLQSSRLDRFVLRVQTRSAAGSDRAFAVKAYSDTLADRVWYFTRAIATHPPVERDGMCLPIGFARREAVLVFPWVDGVRLSDVRDGRSAELLRDAGRLIATLHRLPIVPEPTTTAGMLMAETRARCDRLHTRWAPALSWVEPVVAELEDAARFLDPVEPAPAHGDLGAGQFLWTGQRLVLFDWDRFGYTDPAYDVGHF